MGACIQCGNRNCFQAFHVTCGRRAKLYLKMKSTHGGPASLDASVLKAYCDKHVWRLASGAPIVPQVVFDAVAISLQRFGVRKRKDFAAECCKYWTLKRESRRGASLLKRLQLQMETFSSTEITRRNFMAMGSLGRSRLQRRIEMAELLIDDLASLRVICNEIKERGKVQSTDAALLNDMVDTVYFPIISRLQPILRKAQQ